MTKKKANTVESPAAETASALPAGNSELETLRNLIFGNRERDLQLQLEDLDERIQSSERDQSRALNRKLGAIRETTAAEIKDMRQAIEARQEQDGQLLKAQIEQLSKTLSAQIRALQQDLAGQLEALAQEQTERVRSAEVESRRRDEDLRQELLTLTTWLDEKKASRHDLGRMLVNLGQELQTGADADAGSDE